MRLGQSGIKGRRISRDMETVGRTEPVTHCLYIVSPSTVLRPVPVKLIWCAGAT